jgi:hypothetical protein
MQGRPSLRPGFWSVAIKSNASLREAHYHLGLTYARMGRKEDSEKQLQTASRLDQKEAERQRAVLQVPDASSPSAATPSK